MQLGLKLGLIPFLIITACSQRPALHPRVLLQGENVGREFWLAAPHVLVVVIRGAELIGRPLNLATDGTMELQLVKFSAEVENSIVGSSVNKKIEFYFFAKPDQRPHYWLNPGKRYIVSLRTENGVYRSMSDATQLAIEVNSGRHAQDQLPLDLGVGPTVVYILLTPGKDCDLERFAETLDSAGIDDLASPEFIASLISQLQAHPEARVREHACIAAAGATWSRPPCLNAALQSKDPKVRDTAAGLMDPSEDKIHVPDRLKRDPLSLMPSRVADYIVGRWAAWTLDTRPEVRALACAQLKSLKPNRSFPSCEQVHRRP